MKYEDENGCLVEIDVKEYVKLLEKSIKHYHDMIKYVGTLNPSDKPDEFAMFNDIRTTWQANDCCLCSNFIGCHGCPVYEYTEYKSCENTPWEQMDNARTWEDWLLHANNELRFLIRLLLHYESKMEACN